MTIYKAYDIRGTYPDQIDEVLARRIGTSLVRFLSAQRLVVGRDMREMSGSVTDALCEGIQSMGCEVVDIGLASTPMAYFAIGTMACDGGVVVTASHNPKQYTGFKMCKAGPRPLSGESGIPEIKALTEGEAPEPAARRGRREFVDDVDKFRDAIVNFVGGAKAIDKMTIAVDYANGMGAVESPKIFDCFPGLEVVSLYPELDGTFPNHEANPLKEANLDDLRKKVKQSKATLGLAFDGDADRCAFIDEDGVTVGADLITVILARALLARKPGKGIIYDLRSSRVVPESVRELGGVPVKERVGHSFMKETMRLKDCVGGGELSGHFYFADFYYSDCGVLAAVQVLAQLSKEGRSLRDCANELRKYHQSGEINFRVEDKNGLMEQVVEKYKDAAVDRLDGVMIEYDDWWVNVRPSNTEPYLRLVLEANTGELLREKTAELTALLGTPV